MKSVLLLAILLPSLALAQTPQCVCTSGCKIVSDPLPSSGVTPTTCAIYKMPGRTLLGSAAVVDATVSGPIGPGNASICVPSSTYTYGAAGSKACLVTIPPQVAGSLTVIAATKDSAGAEGPDSLAFTFQVVSALPKPPMPVIWGVQP